jgi:membrane-associated phospholipid phosphatase
MAVVLGQRFGAIGWWIAIPWAILVSITTMLIHEHHLICVVAGFILFVATAYTILPWLKSLCGLDADGRDPTIGRVG